MRRRLLVVTILIISMLLQCVVPLTVVNATSSVEITLNGNLYKAVKANLRNQGIVAEYKDASGLIIISQEEVEKVTTLNLSNSEIDDLAGGSFETKGLEAFTNLTELNLHSNYLTEESNLNVIDKLPNLNKVDLSSNQISSIKTITSFHDDGKIFDITNQNITGKIIIKVDDSENSTNKTQKAIVALPEILTENTNGFNPNWLLDSNGFVTSKIEGYNGKEPQIDYINSFNLLESYNKSGLLDLTNGKTGFGMILNVGEGIENNFKALKGLIKFTLVVNDSTSKVANTQVTYYYAITGSDESGISFNDGNFYRAVKAQLKQGQTMNSEITATSGKNLWTRDYDEALILVIDSNDIVNNIPTLLLNDKSIKDLKGLEEFIGLESNLNISYNYITSLKRVIELEENKNSRENGIRDNYKRVLAELKSYVTAYDTEVANIKTANEKITKANEELAVLLRATSQNDEAIAAKRNEIQGYTDSRTVAENAKNRNNTLIEQYAKKLYKIYQKEYKLVSLLPNSVNYLSLTGLVNANLEVSKANAVSVMERVTTLEKMGVLTDYENWAIKKLMTTWGDENGFQFKEQKLVYIESQTDPELVDIEFPISEFFDLVKNDNTLDIDDYKQFVYIFKCIDALSQIEQYSLIKRTFENSPENYAQEAINDIEKLYKEKGYDLSIYDLILTKEDGTLDESVVAGEKLSTGVSAQALEIVSSIIYTIDIGLSQTQYSGDAGNYINQLAHRLTLISNEDVSLYIYLPRIKKLNIADNKTRDLKGIEALSNLRELNAWKNMVNDISTVQWSSLIDLKSLNLGYNQISNITPLEILVNLEELNLSYNLLSGRFGFKLNNMVNLNVADFSYNQFNDIQYITDQFTLRALASGYTVPEYLRARGIDLNFKYQSLNMDVTISKTDDEFVEFELPLIFRQLEKLDNSRTSFGLDSLGGLVEPEGTTVKLRVPGVGEYQAVVRVEGRNGTGIDQEGFGYGTTCLIKYNVVEPEVPAIPDEPVEPENPVIPETPEEPTNLQYGYPVDDGYVYVLYPETTIEEFANRLVDLTQYSVKITGNKSDKIGTSNLVVITSLDEQTEYAILEVVVKGDINGDGEVDAIDSGIIRKVINDTENLVGSYSSAADVNSDGVIDSLDAMMILKYRADRISSFED